MTIDVRVLTEAFDAGSVLQAFTQEHSQAGGVVSFIGQVRIDAGAETTEGNEYVQALELRHYEPLTLPAMQDLGNRVAARWGLAGLLMWHRVGVMQVGEPIVLVAAAARHRRDAFAATDFAMDHLKSESWFWKREKVGDSWRWIEPRAQDLEDVQRWS